MDKYRVASQSREWNPLTFSGVSSENSRQVVWNCIDGGDDKVNRVLIKTKIVFNYRHIKIPTYEISLSIKYRVIIDIYHVSKL